MSDNGQSSPRQPLVSARGAFRSDRTDFGGLQLGPATHRVVRGRLLLLTAVWTAGVVLALAALERYKATPGAVGNTPPRFLAMGVDASPGHAKLLMFIHPKCPCSKASLSELTEVIAQTATDASVEIVFVTPAGVKPRWESTPLWELASTIPGTKVVRDEAGIRAKKLGAETSGFVLLYDGDGRLRFSGGITRSRGHLGDNSGRRALCALLAGGTHREATSPVFGCPLFSRGAADTTTQSCHNVTNGN